MSDGPLPTVFRCVAGKRKSQAKARDQAEWNGIIAGCLRNDLPRSVWVSFLCRLQPVCLLSLALFGGASASKAPGDVGEPFVGQCGIWRKLSRPPCSSL